MHTLITPNLLLFFLSFIPPFNLIWFLPTVLNIFLGSPDPIKIQNATPLNMSTKVKGLIRGIKKNLSSQFQDDDKEQEIQIGQPTDVKHVAHIGCDGSAVESPSWMKGFDAPSETQSGPLEKTGDSSRRKARNDDSSHRSTRSVETSRDMPLLPRSARNRHRSMDNNTLESESLSKDSSTKTRHTRRRHKGRNSQDQSAGDDSKADARKKSSRRRKSKVEESSGEGSTRSSTKSTADESDLGSDDV